MAHVVAIDLGTTGLKVAVVGDDGAVVALASRALITTFSPDGGAEQDAGEWWRLLGDASREALQHAGMSAGAVSLVVCTSQYMSIVPVSSNGSPVGPVIMWMDRRGVPLTRHLRRADLLEQWLERCGMAPFGADDIAHIAVLRQWHPDAYLAAHAFVEPVDALTSRLVGTVSANHNTVFGLLATDNRHHGATAYDADLVAAAGLEPARLAPLQPMGTVAGLLTAEAAGALGLRAGTTVCGGTIDSATGAIGTRAVRPGSLGVVIGTTSVAVTHIPTMRADHRHALMTAPSPVPGSYVVLAENGAGGKALEHVGALIGCAPAEMIELAMGVPAGSNGVRFVPWLVGSMAPWPDSSARAGLEGLSLATTRADLARAVLEGVAVNMAALIPAVENLAGSDGFAELTFGGGGAAAALWGQVLADACQRVVHRVAEPRATNARGAALLALASTGAITFDDVAGLVPIAATHEPDRRLAASRGRSCRMARVAAAVIVRRGAAASRRLVAWQVTVAAVQMAMSDDVDDNVATAERLVRSAAADGAQIILIPELFEGPYFCIDMLPEHFARAHPIDDHPTVAHFQRLAAELNVVLPISIYERANNATFNTVVMVDADGAQLGIYRKSHIPDGVGYTEKFYFNPGDTGFRVWHTKHAAIGVRICWDQWFPEGARAMALQGAELLFYPTAIGSEPPATRIGIRAATGSG